VTTLSNRRFERSPQVLWRDIGDRVLALPSQATGRIAILGGGSADLWRRLSDPQSLTELADSFADCGDAPPSESDIWSALETLISRGLVRVQHHE